MSDIRKRPKSVNEPDHGTVVTIFYPRFLMENRLRIDRISATHTESPFAPRLGDWGFILTVVPHEGIDRENHCPVQKVDLFSGTWQHGFPCQAGLELALTPRSPLIQGASHADHDE